MIKTMIRYILASSFIISVVFAGISKYDSYASYTVTVSIHQRECELTTATGYAIESTYVIVTFWNLDCFIEHGFTEKHITVMGANVVNHNVAKMIKLNPCDTLLLYNIILVLKTNSPVTSSSFTLPSPGSYIYTTDSAYTLNQYDKSLSTHAEFDMETNKEECSYSCDIYIDIANEVPVGEPIFLKEGELKILLGLLIHRNDKGGRGPSYRSINFMTNEVRKTLDSIISNPSVERKSRETTTSMDGPPYVHLTISKKGVDSACIGYIIEHKYLLIRLTTDKESINNLKMADFTKPTYAGTPIDIIRMTKCTKLSTVVLEVNLPMISSSFLLLRWWITDVKYPYVLSNGKPTRLDVHIEFDYVNNAGSMSNRIKGYMYCNLDTIPIGSPMFINSNGKNILFGLLAERSVENKWNTINITHVLSNDFQSIFSEFEPWIKTNINNIPYKSLRVNWCIKQDGFKPDDRHGYLIEGRYILVTVEESTEQLAVLSAGNIKVAYNVLLNITQIITKVKSTSESIMVLKTDLKADRYSYHLSPVWFSGAHLLRIYLEYENSENTRTSFLSSFLSSSSNAVVPLNQNVYHIWVINPITTIFKDLNVHRVKVELLSALPAGKTPLLGAPIISESDTKSTIFAVFAGFADDSRKIIYIIHLLSDTFRQTFPAHMRPWTEGMPNDLEPWIKKNVVCAEIPTDYRIITMLGTMHNNMAMFPIDPDANTQWVNNLSKGNFKNTKVITSDGTRFAVIELRVIPDVVYGKTLFLLTSVFVNNVPSVMCAKYSKLEDRTHKLLLTEDGIKLEALSLHDLDAYAISKKYALIVAFDDTGKYGILPLNTDASCAHLNAILENSKSSIRGHGGRHALVDIINGSLKKQSFTPNEVLIWYYGSSRTYFGVLVGKRCAASLVKEPTWETVKNSDKKLRTVTTMIPQHITIKHSNNQYRYVTTALQYNEDPNLILFITQNDFQFDINVIPSLNFWMYDFHYVQTNPTECIMLQPHYASSGPIILSQSYYWNSSLLKSGNPVVVMEEGCIKIAGLLFLNSNDNRISILNLTDPEIRKFIDGQINLPSDYSTVVKSGSG